MTAPLFDDFVDRTIDAMTWDAHGRQTGASVWATPAASCATLLLPANATVHQPAGCAGIHSHQMCHYGTYAARFKAGRCSPDSETVSSFFTYWHGDDPVGNNHEIDIEVLGSEPETIYLTVWTHADHQTGLQRRITRVIDLRSGRYKQSQLDGEGFLARESPLAPPAFPVTGSYDFKAADFDASANFYTYAFEWDKGMVRYSIVLDGQTCVLWELDDKRVVPTHPARTMANLWWSDVHWNRAASAKAPTETVQHQLDWIRYEPA